MLSQDLVAASWNGADFFVSSAGYAGGRKVAEHDFVGSDRRSVEDLGKLQPTFSIRGVVAARYNTNGDTLVSYQENRDKLLKALDTPGRGTLIHPFLGRLVNIVATSFNLNEDMTRLGEAAITITFKVSNSDGQPVKVDTVLTEVAAGVDATEVAVEDSFSELWRVTAEFNGNFQDAVQKGDDFIQFVNEAVAPAAVLAGELDTFSKSLSDFSDSLVTLITTPRELAESITRIITSVGALYATPGAVVDSMKRLFDFGDSDNDSPPTTAGRVERQMNRDLMDDGVQALALANAYEFAAATTFTSVAEIDEVSADLEAQYQKIVARETIESEVAEALTQTRIVVSDFFANQRITQPRVIEVDTFQTPARVLSFSYYGTSEFGDEIANLNNLQDSAFIETGSVKILTA